MAVSKEPAVFNSSKPARINANEASINFLTGTDMNMLPIISRMMIIPATNEERPNRALPCLTRR